MDNNTQLWYNIYRIMSIEQTAIERIESDVWYPEKGALLVHERQGCETWSATPGNAEISRKQDETGVLAWAALLDPRLRPPFANNEHDSYVEGLYEFVELVYLSREANRAAKNFDSYNQKLYQVVDTDPSLCLEDKLAKAEAGNAHPIEILALIDGLGMGSAELAKLTHIWGYRLEYLKRMREQVNEAIQDRLGVVYDEPITKYGIIGINNSTHNGNNRLNAIAMKRKTLVGQVDDTAIYERTTFIVRIDKKSHIDREVASYVKSIDVDNTAELIKRIIQDGRLVDEAIRLVAKNDLESVVPMSTTIFGRNDVNLGLLETRRQADKLQVKRYNDAMSPELQQLCIKSRLGAVAIPLTQSPIDFQASV